MAVTGQLLAAASPTVTGILNPSKDEGNFRIELDKVDRGWTGRETRAAEFCLSLKILKWLDQDQAAVAQTRGLTGV